MKKINLYIDNKLVEIDFSQSLLLYTYSHEELTNPTILKNNYSLSLSLKGTRQNNKIFSYLYRNDWKGISFNYLDVYLPNKRVPFEIRDELGAIQEQGYVKLNDIERVGGDIIYKIVLYGGMGDFFYGLKYNTLGDEKKLSELNWMGGTGADEEFTFIYNNVSILDAWNENTADTKWSYINFAPMYNGLSEDIDNNKVLINVNNVNTNYQSNLFATSYTEDSKTFTPRYGYILAELGQEFDEWKMKELRSCSQMPVFSVKKFFDAICSSSNNGGYEIILDSDFFNNNNPYYNDLWCTIGNISKSEPLSTHKITEHTISGQEIRFNIPTGNRVVNANINLNIELEYTGSYEINSVSDFSYSRGLVPNHVTMLILQAVAYDSNNNVKGASIVLLNNKILFDYDKGLKLIGYKSVLDNPYIVNKAKFSRIRRNVFGGWNVNFSIDMDTYALSYIKIHAYDVGFLVHNNNPLGTSFYFPDTDSWHLFTNDIPGTSNVPFKLNFIQNGEISVEIGEGQGLKSNQKITKKDLFQNLCTPCDFLLSYAKMFGLYFIKEKDEKKVYIRSRGNFYLKDDIINIDDRIDRSKGYKIKMRLLDNKTLRLKTQKVEGRLAEEYKIRYGEDYGNKRINIDIEFDSQVKDLFENFQFCGAVSKRNQSVWYCVPYFNEKKSYNFQKLTTKYTYYNGDDTAIKEEKPQFTSSEEPFIPEKENTDITRKIENETKDNKQCTGANILLFFNGRTNVQGKFYRMTNDTNYMLEMNGGKACWLLEYNTDDSKEITSLPLFDRYRGTNTIEKSLELGNPLEIYDSLIREILVNSDVYSQFWEKFLSDRYANTTRVVSLYLDVQGMTVDNEMLRKIYYFDNSYWILNKINNYDMTGKNLAECDFIRIIDKNNLV